MTSPPPIVLVEWEDIVTLDQTTWVHRHKALTKTEPYRFSSVGFLLLETDTHVVITDCWRDDCVGPRVQYPKGCIHAITVLNP